MRYPNSFQPLIKGIERCLDEGTRDISRSVLEVYSQHDTTLLAECLRVWERDGKLIVLNPLDQTDENDTVVRMLDYLETKSPWPNWP
jgi:hypothetical protein